METFGGGWTLIQRRLDNSIPFWNATWDEYKNGFGSGLDTVNLFEMMTEEVLEKQLLAWKRRHSLPQHR